MVQISKSLIIAAALAAPAFAAPTTVESSPLEVREPRLNLKVALRGARRIGGKVFGGLSAGAAVAPLVIQSQQQQQPQQRDFVEDTDIDARELRRNILNKAALRKAGRIGVSVARPGMQKQGRRIGVSGHLAMQNRRIGVSVPPQDQQQQQLEAREPRLKLTRTQLKGIGHELGRVGHKLKSGIEFGAVAGSLVPLGSQNKNQRRSVAKLDLGDFGIEDFDIREPRLHLNLHHLKVPSFLRKIEGKVAAATGLGGAAPAAQIQQRDLEDLDIREPRLHLNLHHLKLPSLKSLRKIGGKVAAVAGLSGAGPVAPLQQRDFEYLDSREPRRLRLPSGRTLRKIEGAVAAATGFGGAAAAAELQQREDQDLYAREFEDEQMYSREYEEADFEAREPEFEIDMREMAEFDELD